MPRSVAIKQLRKVVVTSATKHRERGGAAKWRYTVQTFNRRTGEKKEEVGQVSILYFHPAELHEFWDHSDLPAAFRPWNVANPECKKGFRVQLKKQYRKVDHFEGELPEDGDFPDSEEEVYVSTTKDAESDEEEEGSEIEVQGERENGDESSVDSVESNSADEGSIAEDEVQGEHGPVDYSNPFAVSVKAQTLENVPSVPDDVAIEVQREERPKRKRNKSEKLRAQDIVESEDEKSEVEKQPQQKRNKIVVEADEESEADVSNKKIKVEKGVKKDVVNRKKGKGKQKEASPLSPPAPTVRRGSTVAEVVITTPVRPRPVSRAPATSPETPTRKGRSSNNSALQDVHPSAEAAVSGSARETRQSKNSAPTSKHNTTEEDRIPTQKKTSSVAGKHTTSVKTPSRAIPPVADVDAKRQPSVTKPRPSSSAKVDDKMDDGGVGRTEEDEDDVMPKEAVLSAIHKQHMNYVAAQSRLIHGGDNISSSSSSRLQDLTSVEITPTTVKDFMDAPGWRFRFITEALVPNEAMNDPEQGKLFKKHYLPKMAKD